jgi:hypothetical protein
MIAILLAAARVASNSLNMAVIEGTDPNVGPRRRDHQGSDSLERMLVADGLSVGTDVIEAFAAALSGDSRTLACDVPKMSGLGRGHRIVGYCSKHSIGGIQSAHNCYKFRRVYPVATL